MPNNKGRRASPGEGAEPHQRADGRWQASVEIPTSGGTRKRKYVYGATKTEALQKLRMARRDLAAGKIVTPARLTVGGYLAEWLQREQGQSTRPRTLKFYQWAVNGHLGPSLGKIGLSKLTRGEVQDFLNAKAVGGLSATTVGHLRAVLRAALHDAMRRELLDRNVAELVEVPRPSKRSPTVLTAEETRRLLDAAGGHRLEALLSVALVLAMRPSEYEGLTWSAVDLQRRLLYVRHGLERRDGILQLADVKTRRPHSVALPDAIVAALGQHRERQELERLVAGDTWEGRDLVFCSQRGRPLLERNVVRTFKAWLARAGLPPEIRLYDLRHSCATLLLAQHVPLRLVMELLGHADIRTTANVYAHVLPELARETAAAMDAIFLPVK
jgi:integrase